MGTPTVTPSPVTITPSPVTPSPVTPVTPAPIVDTPSPTTPPPSNPPNPNGETITVQNKQSNNWWYAGKVEGINSGYFIEVFEVRGSNGDYFLCPQENWGNQLVYGCAPSYSMEYPLSVRITGSDGLIYESVDSILNSANGNMFDLGINIGWAPSPVTQVTPAPVIPVTPAPVTVTPAPIAPAPVTPAPVSPVTPAPVAAPVTPSPISQSDTDKEIIGYFASWQWYDRGGLAAPK